MRLIGHRAITVAVVVIIGLLAVAAGVVLLGVGQSTAGHKAPLPVEERRRALPADHQIMVLLEGRQETAKHPLFRMNDVI